MKLEVVLKIVYYYLQTNKLSVITGVLSWSLLQYKGTCGQNGC